MTKQISIDECIRTNLETYFKELGQNPANNIWGMVMGSVEKAMLETVMQQAEGNQSKASEMLGITRNTLRKKLLSHNLI